MQGIEIISRLLIGTIFTVGSLTKLLKLPWFLAVVGKYAVIPRWAVGFVGVGIPFVELLVGFCLLVGRLRPWSAYAAVALILIFTLGVVINLARGKIDTECGCNSFYKKRIGWHLVFRNMGLAGIAVLSAGHESGWIVFLYPWIFSISLLLVIVPVILAPRCNARVQPELPRALSS